MHNRIDVSFAVGLIGAALLATAACGAGAPPRTAAATQPSPAAFDPAKSDPQALTVADATTSALGGAAAWEQVKQIQWESKYYQNAQFVGWFKHAWDRWNGRHRYETVQDLAAYQAAEQAGKAQEIGWVVSMYDLFDREKSAKATFGDRMVTDEDALKIMADAYKRWQADSYWLTLVHKLRDPGVILGYVGEMQEAHGKCQGGCVVIKVSFEPEVGSDVYFVNINKGTNLPEILEKQMAGGTLGYAIDAWAEAGGLKFPAKLRNLGVNEAIELANIRVGEPDDSLYRVPPQR